MTTWTTEPLGNVLRQIKTGSTPRTSHPEYFNGDIPWFTPCDIGKTKNLTKSSRTISEDGVNSGTGKLFSEGTVLVTCIGEIGRVGVLRQRSSANQQITALTFDETVLPDYAYYWFIANRVQLGQFANEAVVPILNNERLQEVPFSFPVDTEEQTHIVAQLDRSDTLVRACRYAVELTDTFLPAAFLELFGDPIQNPKKWPEIELGQHIDYITSGSRGWAAYYAKSGDMFLRIQNVTRGRLLLNDLTYVRTPENAEARRTQVRPGDVLLSITADLGRSAAIPEGFPTAYINQHLAILRTHGLNPAFLAVLLSCEAAKRKWYSIDRNAVKSGLNFDDIRAFRIVVPPLPLQRKFAAMVEQVERVRAVQREALRQAEHLFASLLHCAFNGEL